MAASAEALLLFVPVASDAAAGSVAVARAITEITRSTAGVAVSPHLFRTASASSAAMHSGSNPHLASALLHHTHFHVTEEHYNRASSLSAGESLRNIIQGYKD